MTPDPRRLLDLIVPFRFLPSDVKDALVAELRKVEAVPREDLFVAGETSDDIFLLEDGQVELIYDAAPFVKPSNVVRAGHYFGERSALLSQGRTHGARAVTRVRCWVLSGSGLLGLIGDYPVFAQAFGTILRDKHGIFLPLEKFIAEVAQSLAQGSFPMARLLELYKTLEPALHPGVADPEDLDLDALTYAVRRLPDNLTSTLAWYFTDDIPALYSDPGRMFPEVATAARRRNVWQMLPGKNMVLLRNGLSDILDFLTNLCVFTVEAQKIRHRLHDPALLVKLNACCHDPDDETFESLDLPFNAGEGKGLKALWGDDILQRLFELVVHHEDWAVNVERQLNNYNSRRSEKWANLVSLAVKDLTGLDPWDFPADWEVHLISSNTHSVTNCLSPFSGRVEEEVLLWADRTGHPALDQPWDHPRDRLYALLPAFWKAHPEKRPRPDDERAWGILRISDQGTTGIAVQLIDTAALGYTTGPRKFLVNIDYAFGEQAEEIAHNLVTLFSRQIRSVNILGKAGALTGRRGDILVPTAFVHQHDDSFQPLPAPLGLDSLRARLPHAEVHVGPLLTVAGTLLQNRALLNFYRNIWKCVGLEMEGIYFARKVIESIQLGVLGDVAQRYYYYVSDVPLQAGERLSAPLAAGEGIPPLYAITRQVLAAILPDFAESGPLPDRGSDGILVPRSNL